jgi:hypothetical protein
MSQSILDVLAGLGEDEELKTAAQKIGHEPEMGYPNKGETRSEVDNQMGNTQMDARAVLHEKALEACGRELEANTWQDPREALTSQATAAAAMQNVAPSDAGRNVRETKTHLPEGSKVAGAFRAAADTYKKTRKGLDMGISKIKDSSGARKAMTAAYRTAKKHPGVAAGVAGAAGAAGAAGTAGGMYLSGRKKEASLADYWELVNREDGEKIASETLSPGEIASLDSQAWTGVFMGRAAALGQIKEAAGL